MDNVQTIPASLDSSDSLGTNVSVNWSFFDSMEAQKYRVNKEMSAEMISLTRALFFTDYNRFYWTVWLWHSIQK